MPLCPVCKVSFPEGEFYCSNDGSALLSDSSPPPCPPPIGVTMPGGVLDGRYRLLARLGEGGVGTVYKAEHLWMQRMVAIKFLHRKVTSSEETAKRFAREARLSSQVKDSHCVVVFDFARTPDGTFYLVMEFIEGENLRELLARKERLDLEEAIPIFIQLIQALGAAHRFNIVHRDVKPENVMLQPKKEGFFVKILDFGIARRWSAFSSGSAELTMPGRTLGTPEYMSPEQALGHDLDGRADLYSVGCLLFEAICGRRPFPSEDPVALMRAHVQEPPPRAREVSPEANIPAALEMVLRKALAKSPKERYPNAEAFVEALQLASSLGQNP